MKLYDEGNWTFKLNYLTVNLLHNNNYSFMMMESVGNLWIQYL